LRDSILRPAPFGIPHPLEWTLGMPSNGQSKWDQVRNGRVRILWLVLGALLLVSALPIGLYHRYSNPT
jgi:hypothetical protein